ncbi:MAG TPA: helix-turn-helix transcriptional regulator [Stellaceae bacterium]|nr:helix-turn-helix transcriptional regulator [Stellaceae bacterium]
MFPFMVHLDDNRKFCNITDMAHVVRVRSEIVFPNNIKALRTRKQLTQGQLGRLMDPPLSESTISKMEGGERRPTNLQLANLAAILDCRADEIPVVTGRDPPAAVRDWQTVQEDAVRRSVESGAAATGYVLALLRKRYGKTMQQVASAIGMTLSVYHRMEMASRVIQADEIAAIAKFYGLTTGALMTLFERRAHENRQQLDEGVPPERLLPRTPRALLKDDPKWGELGALERYAMRRSIRRVRPPSAPTALPVYGQIGIGGDGTRAFTISRETAVGRLPLTALLPAAESGFLVRNFSTRLGFLMRPGSLAHVDPKAPVALGDLAFLVRRDGTADAALVTGDGLSPLRLKMYNPEEEIAADDSRIAEVLRIGMLILS